jgi:eukaryotic-like serine/threonine-protein kinase
MRENIPHFIGRYDIVSLLGEGGMARAYLAVSRGPAGFNKLAVIKQILPSLASDADFIAMFLDEARLAARLHHPNIVQTFDVSEQDGSYVLAMEYLEGQTLSGIYRRVHPKSIPLSTHLWILTQVLIGLHYAHTLCDYDGSPLGVVHRDVSPGNVLVTYAGEVKLLDFGVAKARCAIAGDTDKTVKGKPGYCAPEQFRTAEPDARADVFAVGVMLWEALAGRRLNRGATLVDVAKARLSGTEPKIRDIRPDIDPDLADICDKALAIDPVQRFSTALEFQMALQSQLRKLGEHGRTLLVGMLDEAFSADRHEVRKLIEKRLVTDSAEVRALVADPQSRPVAASGLNPSPKIAAQSPRRRFVPAAVLLVGAVAVGASASWFLGRSRSAGNAPTSNPSRAATATVVVDPLPAPAPPLPEPAAPPTAEEPSLVPARPPTAPTAEASPPEPEEPATLRQAPPTLRQVPLRRRRASFAVAASAARQTSLSGGEVVAAPESFAPRASARRGAALNEPQGAVAPGTHLVRPSGRITRGSIDEKDPYSP